MARQTSIPDDEGKHGGRDATIDGPGAKGTESKTDGPMDPTAVWIRQGEGADERTQTLEPGKSSGADPRAQDTAKGGITAADARRAPSERQSGAGPRIGDYEVMGELGRGGMGVVYKARHVTLNRVVALKMILSGPYATDAALKRFLAEARAVARLQHSGIVQIFDIGEHQGLPYFSLEFVEGRDLQRDLQGQPREARSAAELVERLASAMQYAHDHGVLHRDLKPSNILLAADGSPKIADFGLAKEVDAEGSTATSQGTVMGSPSYMPPEQARGEASSISPRSDLYSLGAILYQILTGRPPFLADRPVNTVMQVIHNEPVSPRVLQPGVPVDVETICMKSLQKDPSARYESCRALADDLRRFLNGEPILARPISRVERAWRWCERHPATAVPSGLAGLFILATALVASWAWWTTAAQATIISEQRDQVQEQRDEARKERDEARRQRTIADEQRVIANQRKVLAEEKEELARRQATLALENIQFVVTDIDDALKKQPGSNDLRIAILESVAKKWDELDVEMTGGIRGEAIPTLMALRQKIASALYELDRLKEADREYEKLYARAKERIEIKGRTDSARANLAKVGFAWAPIKRRLTGDPTAALGLLEQSIAVVRETIRDPHPEPGSPTPVEIRELLAVMLQNLGVEHLTQGRLAEAAAVFREGLDLLAKVLDTIRSEPGFAELNDDQKDSKTAARQISHDKAAIALAYVLMRLGRSDESFVMYDKAIAGRREIFARRPTMPVMKLELAGHLGNFGQSLLWIGQLEKASPVITESTRLFEEVFAADSEKADYKRQLTTALYRLATLRDLEGNSGESLSLFERCRQLRSELCDASPDEKNKINLMLAEARVGNSEKARSLADELAAMEQVNGERHLERARALCQLARKAPDEQRGKMLDEAQTALERAIQDGYRDPFRVEHEPDLTPLRGSERFTRAVIELKSARSAEPSK
ncbi:MAG: hypothetical protein FJ297_08995 [Planctomycetes bacterium]|nr:hypothetical protein [Planctomycetota bacterium]